MHKLTITEWFTKRSTHTERNYEEKIYQVFGLMKRTKRLETILNDPEEKEKLLDEFCTQLRVEDDLVDYIYRKLNMAVKEMPPKKRILLKYDYGYKFSKSDPSYTPYFAENHFFDYRPHTLARTNETPFSFIVNKENLPRIAVYGDQLTRFAFNEGHPHYKDFIQSEIEPSRGNFVEFQSSALPVDENFSMRNPLTLKSIIKISRSESDLVWFKKPYKPLGDKSLGDVYKALGFVETKSFLDDALKKMEQDGFEAMKKELDDMLPGGENIVL